MGYEQLWLDYTRKVSCKEAEGISYICVKIQDAKQDALIANSVKDLQKAFLGMAGSRLTLRQECGQEAGAVQAGNADGHSIFLAFREGMKAEAYHLFGEKGDIVIEASDSRGILYGTFDLIRQLQMKTPYIHWTGLRRPPCLCAC